MEDWRDARAKALAFKTHDVAGPLAYPDDSFDLVFSYNAFEHIPDPEFVLKEISRITCPGGALEDLLDHVQVARDAAFVSRIQDSLDNDSIAQSMARIDAVRRETWEIRAREMLLTATQHPGIRTNE